MIGVYQSPGGNAIDSAERIRSMLEQLKPSFPEGVDYKITYDTTVFVKQSIKEVLHTLFEAFVLVVIVVFLFLGNFRATLIPLIAVPVSLIGTFAVMLALGFSANTVSLLALVLAIGIVVDDAIVVVEAVEAHLEKDPTHLAGRGGAARHGRDHRADHRDHAGAALGVRAGRLHSRHFGRAVPPVRGRRVGVDGDLGDQRADAVAGAVRGPAVGRATAPSAGRSATCCRGIDKARDGYAAIVRRLVRIAVFGLVALLVVDGRRGLAVPGHADRLPAVRGPGRRVRRGPVAGRRLGQSHRCGHQARRGNRAQHAGRRRRHVGRRLQHDRRAVEIEQRVPGHDAQAVRGAQGHGAVGGRHHRQAAARVPRHPGGDRVRLQSAADHRARHRQRLRIPAPEPGRRQRRPISRRSRAAWCSRPTRIPALQRVFTTYSANTPQLYLDIDREKVQTLGVDVSDVFNALQSVLGSSYVNDFNLFGRTWQVNDPGRGLGPRQGSTTSTASTCATGTATWCRSAPSPSARLVLGPQSIIRYNNFRSVTINGGPAPGYSSGEAIAAMEQISAETLPRGYGYEWTGTALQEKEAAGKTTMILALAVLFAYLFLVGLYESWTIPVPVLLSVSVGVLGAMAALWLSGSTTISTPRSAWSC